MQEIKHYPPLKAWKIVVRIWFLQPAKKFQKQLLLLEVGYLDDRHISIEKFSIWKLAELNWFINIFLGLSDSQIIILYKNCGLVFHNCTLLIFWGHNKWMSWGMKINDDSIHFLSPNQSREQTIDDGIMLTNTENAFLKIIVCDYRPRRKNFFHFGHMWDNDLKSLSNGQF